MNITLLLPRRKRRNQNWLMRLARFIGNYRYFRQRGFTIKASVWYAQNTLSN